MNPYQLNAQAIRDFMVYHGLKKLKEVSELLCISQPYLTQLMAGQRPLNESVRLRFQKIMHKNQDQLFLPNFDALPFTHQSLAWAKYYGVIPYQENSISKESREGDSEILTDASQNFGNSDGQKSHFSKKFYQSS